MESFNEAAQRAKVVAGFKGGPMLKSPVLTANRTIVSGYPQEVSAKFQAVKPSSGKSK